ncbi:MAG: hypothetical protein ABIQ93_05125 [Saprospiraceae bacterium]
MSTPLIPQVNYVTDSEGKPLFVQLPIQDWTLFIEEYQRLVADELRAAVAVENWKTLSKRLPNIPEISMAEIVEEVKAVRKMHNR